MIGYIFSMHLCGFVSYCVVKLVNLMTTYLYLVFVFCGFGIIVLFYCIYTRFVDFLTTSLLISPLHYVSACETTYL